MYKYPPEDEEGNTEYKWKLIKLSVVQFNKLKKLADEVSQIIGGLRSVVQKQRDEKK